LVVPSRRFAAAVHVTGEDANSAKIVMFDAILARFLGVPRKRCWLRAPTSSERAAIAGTYSSAGVAVTLDGKDYGFEATFHDAAPGGEVRSALCLHGRDEIVETVDGTPRGAKGPEYGGRILRGPDGAVVGLRIHSQVLRKRH
jgi:hypothetical protein